MLPLIASEVTGILFNYISIFRSLITVWTISDSGWTNMIPFKAVHDSKSECVLPSYDSIWQMDCGREKFFSSIYVFPAHYSLSPVGHGTYISTALN